MRRSLVRLAVRGLFMLGEELADELDVEHDADGRIQTVRLGEAVVFDRTRRAARVAARRERRLERRAARRARRAAP